MIKLLQLLFEDRLEAMKDKLKLSDDDVLYLKSLNVPEKYIIWLANQYKLNIKQHNSDKRFKEDAYKYENALQKFFELSNKNKITDKNINNYKDIFALYDVIEKFDDTKSKREIEKDIKLKGAKKIFENDKWLVVIPKTKEAACYYGKGTMWCTAATESNNYFNDYNSRGNLYIFINKKDSNERYQYWYGRNAIVPKLQFTDINDKPYNIQKFKRDNLELSNVIDDVMSDVVKDVLYKVKRGYVLLAWQFKVLPESYKISYLKNRLKHSSQVYEFEYDMLSLESKSEIVKYKIDNDIFVTSYEYAILDDKNKLNYALDAVYKDTYFHKEMFDAMEYRDKVTYVFKRSSENQFIQYYEYEALNDDHKYQLLSLRVQNGQDIRDAFFNELSDEYKEILTQDIERWKGD